MLAELDHVFKQAYLSREHFLRFLRDLAGQQQLIETGFLWRFGAALVRVLRSAVQTKRMPRPSATVWANVHFLHIQKHGASQHEMSQLLKEILAKEHRLTMAKDQAHAGPYLYLDDILFTGNRIVADLQQWIEREAPPRADLVIAILAGYRRGILYTHTALLRMARQVGKTIRIHWLKTMELEDRRWAGSAWDGFRPSFIPDTPLARAYLKAVEERGFIPALRVPGTGSQSRFFSSEAGRQLLEQQFLLSGLKIRSFCKNPQEIMRPLGYHVFHGLGFGAPLVTYRNCPNNCPLALWWGDPNAPPSHPLGRWYSLFPRKVY